MGAAAWNVINWAPVLATPKQLLDATKFMEASHSGFYREDSGVKPTAGQALWRGSIESRPFGLSWDWVQMARGAVIMADPMTILTNLVLIDDDGHPVSAAQTVLHLNNAVRELKWQGHVFGPVAAVESLPRRLAVGAEFGAFARPSR